MLGDVSWTMESTYPHGTAPWSYPQAIGPSTAYETQHAAPAGPKPLPIPFQLRIGCLLSPCPPVLSDRLSA